MIGFSNNPKMDYPRLRPIQQLQSKICNRVKLVQTGSDFKHSILDNAFDVPKISKPN